MKIEKFNIIWNKCKLDYHDYLNFKRNNEINSFGKVLILMRRTPDLIFAICMCLEKGITYIPVDPIYPKERIQYIVDHSHPNNIITNVDLDIKDIITEQGNYNKDTAYVIYTSGSTGSPKGVEVTRDGLMNFMDGITEIIDFSEGKTIACFTTPAFDIFFLESIMALYKGLTVVLANEDEQYNPKLMAELIIDNRIDIIQMTPSRIMLLINYDKDLVCLKNVKEILIGGEPFSPHLLKVLQTKTTAKIYNMYGPTETTIWSTVSDLTQKDRVDIGRPIKNTQIIIVDEELNILENGQAGEICIAGKGLANGYHRDCSMTAEKFVYLPQNPGIRVYRTGDLGKFLPDDDLAYLGRIDNQVKIRGYRCEPEEIEMQIVQYQGISQAVVRAVAINENDKILEAIYISETDVDTDALKTYLANKLPEYMIPVRFTKTTAFSYTPNGKIDRTNLNTPDLIINIANSTTSNDKLSEFDQKAFMKIKLLLPEEIQQNVTIDTELSQTGTDSITFIKIIVSLEETFHFVFEDEMLLFNAFPTIRSLIEYVKLRTDYTR
jgi:amino acid adenylation domain-containing protein